MKKIIFVFYFVYLFSLISLSYASSMAVCRVPMYDGICCSFFTSDYLWPSGNGICCGGMPYSGEGFCPWSDFTPPAIMVLSPLNISYNVYDIWMNATLNEAGSWCKYSLDGFSNITMGHAGGLWSNFSVVGDGVHNVKFYCSDTSGNTNSTNNTYFFVDTTAPIISVVPIDTVPSLSNVTFNVSCVDNGAGCNITTVVAEPYNCTINHTVGTTCKIALIKECEIGIYNYYLNSTDMIGNTNSSVNGTFNVKMKDGCGCIVSNDCFSGTCIGLATCASANPPELYFDVGGGEAEFFLGKIQKVLIKVKNNMNMRDSIELNIYGDPVLLQYWAYFDGQKYGNRNNKIVSVGPNSEITIPINVLGGKVGSYRLIVEAKSITNGLKSSGDTSIVVLNFDKNGAVSETPGIGWSGILAILVFASLFSGFKK